MTWGLIVDIQVHEASFPQLPSYVKAFWFLEQNVPAFGEVGKQMTEGYVGYV